MIQQTYSPEEIARRGDEIYERQIRTKVEAEDRGRVVAIDVDTGDYSVGDTAHEAARALRARRPSAQVWVLRIGQGAFQRLGHSGPTADR